MGKVGVNGGGGGDSSLCLRRFGLVVIEEFLVSFKSGDFLFRLVEFSISFDEDLCRISKFLRQTSFLFES